jgi:hypothetical protein
VCPKMDANLLIGFTICMFYIFLDCGFSNHATMWVCKILKTYKVNYHFISFFHLTLHDSQYYSFRSFVIYFGCFLAALLLPRSVSCSLGRRVVAPTLFGIMLCRFGATCSPILLHSWHCVCVLLLVYFYFCWVSCVVSVC